MSLTLDPVAISGTTVNAVGGSFNIQNAPAKVIALDLYNASPVDLKVTGLPSGDFWLKVNQGTVIFTPGPFGTVNFVLGQVPSLTNAPSSVVLITYYIAGDSPPPPGMYYIGRLNAIGNTGALSVSSTTANLLQGVLQLHGVTEAGSNLDPGPTLLPASASEPLHLSGTDVNKISIGGIVLQSDGNMRILGAPRGVALSGLLEPLVALGMPGIIGETDAFAVSDTLSHTLFSYTTPNDGLPHTYRLTLYFILNNGTSGNALVSQVFFTDMRSTAMNFSFLAQLAGAAASALLLMNGGTSFLNGDYTSLPVTVTCKPNTVLSATYRDPTNTPADQTTIVVERLS